MTNPDFLNGLAELAQRARWLQEWAVHAGVSAPPHDAVRAPWSYEQAHRLNARQDDPTLQSYQCPICQIDLWATPAGWVCARRPAHFRQDWALRRHITDPFTPRSAA